ncbi:MAG: hypothetical protein M3O35_20740 [Acidobacteriota bacterium]|nr:hypothetical protein [Acidobacteriota bacterium]
MKRISRQALLDRLATAREAYLKEMEAAGDDDKKVSLAEKKLRWAEEAAGEAFNHHGTLYTFAERIPVIGHPITLMLGLIEKGGLARGIPLGILLCVMLIVATEVFQLVHKVVGSGTDISVLYPAQAEQRTNAINWSVKAEFERETVYRDEVRTLTKAIPYYLIWGLDADSIKHSGGELKRILEGDRNHMWPPGDRELFERGARMLPAGAKVFSFFHHYDASLSHVLYLNIEIPFTSKPAHRDLAILTDENTKAEFVLVALGRARSAQVALIPLSDYQSAGLPMHTPLDRSPAVESDEEDAPFRETAPVLAPAAPPPDPPGVPFFPIAQDLYQHMEDDPDVPGKLEEVVTSSEVEKLPEGTSFVPYLKTAGDPNSALTIKGPNKKVYILVTTRDQDGREIHGMILRSDYLKSANLAH